MSGNWKHVDQDRKEGNARRRNDRMMRKNATVHNCPKCLNSFKTEELFKKHWRENHV